MLNQHEERQREKLNREIEFLDEHGRKNGIENTNFSCAIEKLEEVVEGRVKFLHSDIWNNFNWRFNCTEK